MLSLHTLLSTVQCKTANKSSTEQNYHISLDNAFIPFGIECRQAIAFSQQLMQEGYTPVHTCTSHMLILIGRWLAYIIVIGVGRG